MADLSLTTPDVTRIAYFNGLRAALVQEAMQLRMGGDLTFILDILEELASIPPREDDDGGV